MGIFQELSQARALLLVRSVNHFKSSRFRYRSGPERTSVHLVQELHSFANDFQWKEAAGQRSPPFLLSSPLLREQAHTKDPDTVRSSQALSPRSLAFHKGSRHVHVQTTLCEPRKLVATRGVQLRAKS